MVGLFLLQSKIANDTAHEKDIMGGIIYTAERSDRADSFVDALNERT